MEGNAIGDYCIFASSHKKCVRSHRPRREYLHKSIILSVPDMEAFVSSQEYHFKCARFGSVFSLKE